MAAIAHGCDVRDQILPVLQKPIHTAAEPVEFAQNFGIQSLYGIQRDQADDRAHLYRLQLAIGCVQHIVEKIVLLRPHGAVVRAQVIDGVRNVEEMLPELARDVFVGGVFAGQFQRDGQQIQRIHRHPTGAVRLLYMSAGRQRLASIEQADVVQSEEPALKNIAPFRVLPVHPPGEVEQ